MRTSYLIPCFVAALLLFGSSCSRHVVSGVPQETAPGQDGNDSRSVSATFTTFFSDSINASSFSRWTANDMGGHTAWVLDSAAQSAPDCFRIGGNYWNNENDYLTTTNSFSVPANKQGLRFKFYSKWNIAANDHGYVEYSKNGGTSWIQLANFTGGSSPSYPGWTAYNYSIPAPGAASNFKLRFHLTSDGSGTAWGFAIDTVSFFQTNVGVPTGLTATDGTVDDAVTVAWTAPSDGGTIPTKYYVYRSTTQNGTYSYIGQTSYPTATYDDAPGDHNTYWYKVRGYTAGYSYGAFSNSDSGYGRGTEVYTADGSGGDLGGYASLAIVGGHPAIAYRDGTNYDVKYVRATTTDGSAWGTPQTPDSTGAVGQYTSLAVVNGNPAISYYDGTNGDLKFVRASNSSGSAWDSPQTLASTGDQGQYTSLAVVNGNPAISYQDYSNGALRYLRATDADGTGWGSVQTPDSTAGYQVMSSMKIVDGNPAIGYYDSINHILQYVRATDANGSAWGTVYTPDDGTGGTVNVGYYPSLAIVNGDPAISYQDITNSQLKFVRATDADGVSWDTVYTPDDGGGTLTGYYTSLAVLNGYPVISYYNYTSGDLKLVRAGNASGSSWLTPETPDGATADVGNYSSLAVVNGSGAGIAYHDNTNNILKFAVSY